MKLNPATLLAGALIAAALPVRAQSLYDERSYRPLTADSKAYRVGDILTVQVFENATASASADSGSRRANGITGDLKHGTQSTGFGLSVGSDFDGGGRTQRSNRVLITLSVSVREVLANGDLLVGGEQLLSVSDEQQKVTLEGRVRPQDISDGNIVLSTRLADARISYNGEGAIAEAQTKPWWRKLLDTAGL